MQGVVFAKVLQMSLTGCYSIGIVLLARLLLKRCGRVYVYCLWVLMFAGLCLPISLPGHYSLIPRQVSEFSLMDVMMQEKAVGNLQGQEAVLWNPEGSVPDPEGQEGTPQNQTAALHRLLPDGILSGQLRSVQSGRISAESFDVQGAANIPDGYRKEAGVSKLEMDEWNRMVYLIWAERVWLLGILLFALYHLSAMYRMACRCSGYGQPEWKEGGWIVEAEGVPSPFLWGYFRPVIYLPSGLKEEERIYILAHESVHRNRRDYLVRLLILAVAVLHWFNPFVWIAYVLCIRDMEISCDEAVLQGSGTGIRKSYAESLLKYAARQNRFLIGPLGFGEPSVKSRIKNVLYFRKKSVWISLAAGLCVIGVAAGLLHHPSEEKALPDRPVEEAEPLPEEEEPSADESEGLVVNNGGEIICVAGEYYYMDGMPLYSDGEALYTSVLSDDGTWHVCRYETNGSCRRLFDGWIVDSTESGQVLYCMLPAGSGRGKCLGWYGTRSGESGRFSGENVSWLGKYEGFLYLSRQEADGLHVDRIRETDLKEEQDLIKERFPAEEILKFCAEEGGKRLVFAARTQEENEDGSRIRCCSYDSGSGELISKELTGLPYFAMMDGYIYFQRYKSREDLTLELFRTDYGFSGEEQVGEGLTLLCTEEDTNTLLVRKEVENPDFDYVGSLVRIWPDQKKEQMLLDMERMLPAVWSEDLFGDAGSDVYLDWEFRDRDRVAYSELNQLGEQLYATVSHYRDQENVPLEEAHLTVNAQGGIGIWFPGELTPGREDTSWYRESMIGMPIGMEADGWDLENVTDVREHVQELPMEPDASERKRTYLLGETEYWTLYGKGDYKSMLLARNGRYTEINHPYMSNGQICPELMEADLDRDGITELAIRLNLKCGTDCRLDSLLVADFQNNGAWVYQFPEEDFAGQLMTHLTGERTECGMQAYIDGEPAGAPIGDEEGGRSFQSVSVGQLIGFSFDGTKGKIQIRAELEFWDKDTPGTAGYNGCAMTADVVWTENHFALKNVGCLETGTDP